LCGAWLQITVLALLAGGREAAVPALNARTGREECHGVGSWVLCGA
jgi:hypothetical protein